MAKEQQVLLFPQGVKVQVAPDEEYHPWPEHLPVPRVGTMEWVQQPDGSYRPMIHTHPVWIRMKEDITEELGLGLSYFSLRRLMRAGFVRSKQVTPGQYAFDLQSFFRHCAAVQADPEFWDQKRIKRFMDAV